MTDELLMLRRLNKSQADRLAKLLAENSRLKKYETLVFRFVDRMNDPAECDLLHDIVAEFVSAVAQTVDSVLGKQDHG